MTTSHRAFNDLDFRSMSIHFLNILVPLVFTTILASAIWASDRPLAHIAPFVLLFGSNLAISSLQKRERYRNRTGLTALRFCLSFPLVCWFAWLSHGTPFVCLFFLPHCFAIGFSFLMPWRLAGLILWNAAGITFMWFLQKEPPGPFILGTFLFISWIAASGAWILERNLILIRKLPEADREKWGRAIGNQAIIGFLVLIAGVALTVFLVRNKMAHARQESLARLRSQAETGIRNLDLRLSAQRSMLEAVSAFFESSKRMENAEFEIFANRLLAGHPSIKTFHWIPKVTAEERTRFEAEVSAETGMRYRITQPESGSMAAASPRPEYFPIRYAVPFEANRIVWGMDVGFAPERRVCIDSTFKRNAYTLCRPFKPATKPMSGWNAVACMPVRKTGVTGIVTALIDLEGMINNTIVDPLPRGFTVGVACRWDQAWIPVMGAEPPSGSLVLQQFTGPVGGAGFRIRVGIPPPMLDGAFGAIDAVLLLLGFATSVLLAYFLFHASRSSLPLEIKVLERTRELQSVVVRAEESNQAKSRFLAQMSHEIRTPLNGVLGMSDAMLHSDISPDSRERIELIKASGMSLLTILNDILDVSKIESGKMRLELKPFRLNALIAEIVGIMRFDADGRGVTLEAQSETPVPDWVLGDPLRVRQIVMNLLSNALKFTPEGTVTLISSYADPDQLRVRILDSGIGIAPEKLLQLFQPFEQADSSTTRKFGGTGLGLVISLQLARMMGGDIKVQSREKVGSEFTLALTLPRATRPVDMGSEAGGHLRKGGRLLLAEDNIVNVRVAKALLAEYFEAIDVAGTGKEALRLLAGADYEMILMDLQMPEMDGMEATREIRKRPEWSDLPIIALSANVFASDRKNCLEAGMQDFLEKPITKAALHRVLAQYLGPA
ncbi:MAG: ATP-binding protein [Fibrobacteria bacterium]